MMINQVSMMIDAELVATVLGRKEPDDECFAIADMLMIDRRIDIATANLPLCKEDANTRKRNLKIEAAVELGRRAVTSKAASEVSQINKVEDVLTLMKPLYAHEDREVFYSLNLNMKNHLIRIEQISIGSLNASIVHPRELLAPAVRLHAASIILTHNHPSGDPTPSGADMQLTRRIQKSCDVLGIDLVDHVVIGKGGKDFVSMRDKGML